MQDRNAVHGYEWSKANRWLDKVSCVLPTRSRIDKERGTKWCANDMQNGQQHRRFTARKREHLVCCVISSVDMFLGPLPTATRARVTTPRRSWDADAAEQMAGDMGNGVPLKGVRAVWQGGSPWVPDLISRGCGCPDHDADRRERAFLAQKYPLQPHGNTIPYYMHVDTSSQILKTVITWLEKLASIETFWLVKGAGGTEGNLQIAWNAE